MYKQIVWLVLLSTITVSIAQHLSGWRHCGTTMADVHHIIVQNCLQTPCAFVPGNTYQLQITATALEDSNSLIYELAANFFGLFINLASGNGCNNLVEGQCPATVGNRFSYTLDYTVPQLFPPNTSTFVQLHVFHHNATRGICVEVDVGTS